MKSRIARYAFLTAEGLGIIVAAVVAAIAFVAWRVQAGPTDLTWSAPAVRLVANAAGANGLIRSIGKISVTKIDSEGGYQIDLQDVDLGGEGVEATAKLPHIVFDIYPADLIDGKVGPRRLHIEGAALRIVRRGDRKLKLELGGRTSSRIRTFQLLTGGAYFRNAFELASLSNVSIFFLDENSGRTWRGHGGEALIERTGTGYAARLESRFSIGEHNAALQFAADYDVNTELIQASMAFAEAPVGDLVAVFFNENADLFTAPISGEADIVLEADGAVKSSTIRFRAGNGVMAAGKFRMPITDLTAAASFNPHSNSFSIEKFEWTGDTTRGSLSGEAALIAPAGGKGVDEIAFTLNSKRVEVSIGQLFEAPVDIEDGAVDGRYEVMKKNLSIDSLTGDVSGVAVKAKGTYQAKSDETPSVSAEIALDGELVPETLLKLWPKNLAIGARDFIATRLLKAKLSGIAAKVDFDNEAIGDDGVVSDDAISISFVAEDAVVVYAPGMTPLTDVSGRGILKGNSFAFSAHAARAGRARISKGSVEIPVLEPKGEPAVFRFDLSGDAGEILKILDEKPLSVLAGSNFRPEQFKGPVVAQVEIMRPNLREAPPDSYRYKATAGFQNLDVEEIVGDATLSKAAGNLELSAEQMLIKGRGALGDAPVNIEWRQRFKGQGDKTEILVDGVASAATADIFRIPTRQFVRGEIPFSARALGGIDAIRFLEIDADLTGAAVFSEVLEWIKPAGTPAKGTVKVRFEDAGARIDEFNIAGADVMISGDGRFTSSGAIEEFRLPALRLGEEIDLSISGKRQAEGALAVSVRGERLNASEIIRNLLNDGFGTGGAKTAFELDAEIDLVTMRGGAVFHDAALDFRQGQDGLDRLDFSAVGSDGKRLSVALKNGEADAQLIEAKSDNVGAMLAGIFGISSVRGGAGWLDFSLGTDRAGAPREGAMEAHDLRVVGAPLLAKIFSAGSLTGLADLMNGEGIELKNAMARFTVANGEIRVSEARATGPSVGITAQGAFGLDGDRLIEISGAVAPAYGFNSLLGKTPVIGDLFVNRKGEGLLALTYDVAGPASEPRVTVNPLSALTPGVFRRMFEGRAEEGEGPPEAREGGKPN